MMKINVGEEEVTLDANRLKFNEITLTDYIEQEAAWFDYFGCKLAECEYLMQRREMEYEAAYSQKFKSFKEEGGTDKVAEANAKLSPEVSDAYKEYISAKYKVRLLQQHLKAWDKCHENAQSRGHFLRKEMDKLNNAVLGAKTENYFEKKLDSIIGANSTDFHS
jgi:hypothetical protein